jgi:hypothetical protein
MSLCGKSFDADERDLVPDRLRDRIRNYVDHGAHPGAFLVAVLSGDLFLASIPAREDVDLVRLARFLIRHAPPESWGSAEKVAAWLVSGGRPEPVRAATAERRPRIIRYDGRPLSF